MREAWRRAGAVLLLVAICYGNTLGNDFVWDDRLSALTPASAATILTRRTGAYYRPVVMLSFAADRTLWGRNPVGWHVTNVACHAAVAWLVGTLAVALGTTGGVALASALLFAAHPVQTEAVTYISGRTDVLCALFVLLALLAWRRARHGPDVWAWASTLAIGLALLAKESAALVAPVLLMPCAHPGPTRPRPLLPLLATGAWLVAWITAGGAGSGLRGLGERLPAIGIAALENLRLIVWPVHLHLERFTPVAGWPVWVAVAVWVLLAALGTGMVVAARRVPGGLFLLALAALSYLPVSGVVPVYPAVADRVLFTAEHFLYFPLAGLIPLACAIATRWWPHRLLRVLPVVTVLLLIACAALVIRRNRDWRDEDTLFRQTLAYAPPAARVWFNLANLELAANRNDEAIRLYGEALAREPGDAAAHLNRGIAFQRQRRLDAAETDYRRALELDPSSEQARRGLAAMLAARGAVAEANRVLGDPE